MGWGRQLAATEFEAAGDGEPGLAMLEREEIRYPEAYLLWQGRRWSDAEDGIDAGPGEASAFDPLSGQARPRACVAESAGLSGLRILHTEAATSFGGQEFCIYKEMVAMASAAITWRPCASPRPSWAAGCARRASRSTTC